MPEKLGSLGTAGQGCSRYSYKTDLSQTGWVPFGGYQYDD